MEGLPLPPLNFSGGSAYGGAAGAPSPFTQGAWTVNLGGSGTSLQAGLGGGAGAPGGLSPIVWALIAVGAAWLLLHKLA